MALLSVVIITYNEEQNLRRCLASVTGVANEILVVDSSSTDGTVAVADSYNARVIDHAFEGYGQQKNFATSQATHDWILSLDADEELTPALVESIKQVMQQQDYDVYRLPRLTNYCGQWIHHCGWYPDYQTRLYNRTKGRWIEKKVHEYWALDAAGRKGTLNGDLLHYSFTSMQQQLQKIEKYSELAARAAVDQGKNASLLKVIFSPVWHFITDYIIRLGFLDGYYGWVICKRSAYQAYLKYSKIRRYSK